jgi:hypothetical protein
LDDDISAIEETWTFVGDDREIDLARESKDREQDYDMRIDVEAAGTCNGGINIDVEDDLAR